MIKVSMGVFGPGFFYLPDGIKLYCSFCGSSTKNDDLKLLFSDKNGGFKLGYNCSSCGSIGVDPVASKPE